MCCSRYFVLIGAVLAGLAVAAGAFGAHGLQGRFAEKYRDTAAKQEVGVAIPAAQKYFQDYKTAVQYQMWHALGLILIGLLAMVRPGTSLEVAGWSMVAGIVLFSGGLYVHTVGGPGWLGVPWHAIVPFGGVLFLVGWIALAIGACPCGTSVPSQPQAIKLNIER